MYFRDKLKTLYYIIPSGKVYRQTPCNEEVSVFSIPASKVDQNRPSKEENPTAYFNWTPTVTEGYGGLLVSNNGDIYCYKRTIDKYSILKWIWQGEPDAPQTLKCTRLKESLSLTWEQPRDDVKSITSYEICRSTDVCGAFKVIGKVKKTSFEYLDKDVKVGETYYYKVRAVRDKNETGYSRKATGRITK